VKTTTTLVNESTACLASPRPKAAAKGRAYVGAVAGGLIGHIAGSWLATSRTSMTVPTFHDRWPLCSAT